MCGRFGLFSVEDLAARFGVTGPLPNLEAAYNIAPGTVQPVITGGETRQASMMRWGLIPFWAKDPKIGYKTINARAEGIQDKPSFRKPLRSQRCLVPADGFYEWQKIGAAAQGARQPFFIHLKDEKLFALAGLYDVWQDPAGLRLTTFTIVTTTANELMASMHDRMPVILPREAEQAWLDPATPLPQVLGLLKPYPAAAMAAYPVSDLVNSPRNTGKELIQPLPGVQV